MNEFDALTDDDLQALASECKAQATECYRKAHEWSVKAGKHAERLRKINVELMTRWGWLKRENENGA